MHIYYFVPTAKRVLAPADMIAAGLEYALADGNLLCTSLERGPGEAAGVLAVSLPAGAAEPSLRFDPTAQKWQRHASGTFWAGVDLSSPRPGPADLARLRTYAGTSVRLLDGNDWLIPRCIASIEDRPCTLPQAMTLTSDGQIATRSHPRYAALCEAAFTWWMDWSRQSTNKLTLQQRLQLAADALSVNYRINLVEAIALLDLWSTDEFGLVLRAIIDADEIERWIRAQNEVVEGEKKAAT